MDITRGPDLARGPDFADPWATAMFWASGSQPFMARGPLPSPSPSRGPMSVDKKEVSSAGGVLGITPTANDFWTFYTQFCAILRVLVHLEANYYG